MTTEAVSLLVVIRFQICIFDILNTAHFYKFHYIYQL